MAVTHTRQVIIDHIIGLAVFIFAVFSYKYAKPRHQGFDCNDPTIRLPFQESSIPGYSMWAYTALLPAIPFVATELVLRRHQRPVRRTLLIIYQLYCIFYWGYTITMCSGEVLKQMTGRLRPHFMAMCQPDVTDEQCATGYVLHYNCTNPHQLTPHRLNELRKSFPSGHAMAAAYSGFFVAYYIHHRWDVEQWSLQIKLLAEAAVMLLAFMTSADRVSEHHHHWQDVTVGFVLGICFAYWMIKSLEHRLPLRKRKREAQVLTNGDHIKQS